MDDLIRKLKQFIDADAILSERDELLVYECDGLPQHKALPRAVVFPESTEQVSKIVRVLCDARIPFTARGAGTGVSGGALAVGSGVVIELARMRKILNIDPENQTAVVQTGLINSNLSKAAAPFGLYYAPDPSSQTACTIGGNIAENSGGNHCLKYGVTVDHVIGIRAVLSDGSIVDLDSRAPGYDLTGLFVGSEGTFGIATEATLRLLRVPLGVRTILAEFPDVNDASRTVSAIIAAGLVPAALEMIDAATIRAVEASVFAAGLPLDAEAALIVELDGLDEGLDAEAKQAEEICRNNRARGIRRAADEAERQTIWKARKGAFGAMGRISPDVMIQDAVVPRSKLPAVLAETYNIASKYGLQVANVFHAGDGNLHPLICFDSRKADHIAHVKEAGREIMETCVAAGGTITGEHGVGLDKMEYLPLIFSDDDMEAMLRVRAAFDPTGLCNPGKIIPLLRSCGEKAAAIDPDGRKAAHKPINNDEYRVLSPPTVRSSSGTFQIDQAFASIGRIIGEENVQLDFPGCPLAAFPSTEEEVSELLNLASIEKWSVLPAGSGMWLEAGNPLRDQHLMISTARLTGIVDHEPADLVVTAKAGTKLSELNSSLKNQWLPLDPPDDGRSTLGGIMAAGIGGPLSFGFGRPRHHVIGMRVAMADGRMIKAGGRVVKNVAGYDLCKLFTGSYGTLGIIVELTCKLRPLPVRDVTIIASSTDHSTLFTAASQIVGSDMSPMAIEIVSVDGEPKLIVRYGGARDAVEYQIGETLAVLNSNRVVAAEITERSAETWTKVARTAVEHEGKLVWRASLPRTKVETLLDTFKSIGADRSIDWQAGVGEGQLRVVQDLTDDDAETILALETARETAVSFGGYMILESVPAALKKAIDSWGNTGPGSEITRRIKAHLDPDNLLSPGRFAI